MPGDQAGLRISAQVSIPDEALQFTAARSGGPGGQHVNTTNSKVTLRVSINAIRGLAHDQRERLVERAGHLLTAAGDLVIHAESTRSQQRNREQALERLRSLIASSLPRPRKRKATRPSRGAVERRLQGKRERSQKKQRRRHHGDD